MKSCHLWPATDIDGIMLIKISQKEKDNTVWFDLYVESKNQNKWTNITKQKQSYSYKEKTSVGLGWGEQR